MAGQIKRLLKRLFKGSSVESPEKTYASNPGFAEFEARMDDSSEIGDEIDVAGTLAFLAGDDD